MYIFSLSSISTGFASRVLIFCSMVACGSLGDPRMFHKKINCAKKAPIPKNWECFGLVGRCGPGSNRRFYGFANRCIGPLCHRTKKCILCFVLRRIYHTQQASAITVFRSLASGLRTWYTFYTEFVIFLYI